MKKYYTRACNFFYGNNSKKYLNKKSSLPLNGLKDISFDTIEIVSKNSKKKYNINQIKDLKKSVREKIKSDLKNITKKKKFKNLKFTSKPLLMGILNVTPDSFSDGGKYNKSNKALMHAKHLIKSGCNIIDIGGESTRPGSKEVDKVVEWKRIKNPIKKISKLKTLVSIDTRKSFVMNRVIKYKINLINDISGLEHDKETLIFLKQTKLPFVIHHIQGNPQSMQKRPKYKNALLEIYDFFEKKIKEVRSHGIKHNNILLDPGIGFGKNLKHNLSLLKNISIFHSLGLPLLLGVSKKKFIGQISNKNDSKNRYGGTIASSLYLMTQGVQILRIHDINEIKQGINVFTSLKF